MTTGKYQLSIEAGERERRLASGEAPDPMDCNAVRKIDGRRRTRAPISASTELLLWCFALGR